VAVRFKLSYKVICLNMLLQTKSCIVSFNHLWAAFHMEKPVSCIARNVIIIRKEFS
jgi:hypothetical protein